MPELPAARKARYIKMGLAPVDANRIGEDKELYEFFDAVTAGKPAHAKMAANWLLGDLAANPEYKMPPAHLAELIDMIQADEISGKIAKDIFAKMAAGESGAPREIADKHGLKQTTDTGAIEAAIDAVLAANADAVGQYKSGKAGLLGFFVGLVIKATGGKANPKTVSEMLMKKLSA